MQALHSLRWGSNWYHNRTIMAPHTTAAAMLPLLGAALVVLLPANVAASTFLDTLHPRVCITYVFVC